MGIEGARIKRGEREAAAGNKKQEGERASG